jgi:hypothetical protein
MDDRAIVALALERLSVRSLTRLTLHSLAAASGASPSPLLRSATRTSRASPRHLGGSRRGSRGAAAGYSTADPLPSEGGSQGRASVGNADILFAGTFRPGGRHRVSQTRSRLCRGTSRVPASARQSQNVPVSYPRSVGISPLQATQHAHLQGFSSSPLTDSNRRPPPYHGTTQATGRNPRQRFSLE